MDPLIPTDDRLLGVWTLQLSPTITWLGVVHRYEGRIRCAYRIQTVENDQELREEQAVICDLPVHECIEKLRWMAQALTREAIGTPRELLRGDTAIEPYLKSLERFLAPH